MRIGILANYLCREKKTGVEVYAEEVVSRLIRNYPEYQFVLYYNGTIPPKIKFDGLTNWHGEKLKNSNKILSLHFSLPKIVRNDKLEVFFSPGQYIFSAKGVTKISTAYDVAWKYFPGYFPFYKRWIFDFMTWHLCKYSDKIISISNSTRNDLVNLYNCDPTKIYVVHLGYEKDGVEKGTEIEKVKKKYEIGKDYILFLGTLQKRKNIINLVRAYTKANLSRKLVLAGDKGWFFKEIMKSIDESTRREDIILTGYIDEYEKEVLYKNAAFFVLPSLYEGFGIPLLEAMAFGLPVLTSNTSSMPEVVGEAGVIVNPHDTDDIANGLIQINDNINKYKKLSLERIQGFSWEQTAKLIGEVITT